MLILVTPRYIRDDRRYGKSPAETHAQRHLSHTVFSRETLGLSGQYDVRNAAVRKPDLDGPPRRNVVVRLNYFEHRFFRGESERQTMDHILVIRLAFLEFRVAEQPSTISITEFCKSVFDLFDRLDVDPGAYCHGRTDFL